MKLKECVRVTKEEPKKDTKKQAHEIADMSKALKNEWEKNKRDVLPEMKKGTFRLVETIDRMNKFISTFSIFSSFVDVPTESEKRILMIAAASSIVTKHTKRIKNIIVSIRSG